MSLYEVLSLLQVLSLIFDIVIFFKGFFLQSKGEQVVEFLPLFATVYFIIQTHLDPRFMD